MPLAAGARPKKENPAGFRCRFYCKATHPDPFVSPNAMPYYDGAAGDFLLVHRSGPRRLPPAAELTLMPAKWERRFSRIVECC